jgi:hypothetical protein
MAHDRDDSTDDDKGDELNDFESFLREKDKQWTKPATEMEPTEIFEQAPEKLDEVFEIRDAAAVVENSNDEPKSTETVENTPVDTSTSAESAESAGERELPLAKDAVQITTEYKLGNNPISGPYLSETSVAERLDPIIVDLYNSTINIAVTKMTTEQVIEKMHKMLRGIALMRATVGALHTGLTIHMSKMKDAEKEKYRKLNAEAKAKNETKHRIERVRKPSASPVKAKSAAKTGSQKIVDTLKKNGFPKEEVIAQLKTTKRLDSETLAYIEKLVWES